MGSVKVKVQGEKCKAVESLGDVVFILDSRSGSGMTVGGGIEPQNVELRNVECRRVESLRDVVLVDSAAYWRW